MRPGFVWLVFPRRQREECEPHRYKSTDLSRESHSQDINFSPLSSSVKQSSIVHSIPGSPNSQAPHRLYHLSFLVFRLLYRSIFFLQYRLNSFTMPLLSHTGRTSSGNSQTPQGEERSKIQTLITERNDETQMYSGDPQDMEIPEFVRTGSYVSDYETLII